MQQLSDPASRGRSIEITRGADETRPKTDPLEVVKPTGPNPLAAPTPTPTSAPVPVASEPEPRNKSIASRTDLPAALFEKRSVAQSPVRSPITPEGSAAAVQPKLESSRFQVAEAQVLGQPATVESAPQPIQSAAMPTASHHASSNSTVTITPSRPSTATKTTEALTVDDGPTEPFVANTTSS